MSPSPTLLQPLMFFNRHQAAVVEAMAARIVPSEAGSPGAREARAIVYIDRALSGYFASLQVLYREGVERVDAPTRPAGWFARPVCRRSWACWPASPRRRGSAWWSA